MTTLIPYIGPAIIGLAVAIYFQFVRSTDDRRHLPALCGVLIGGMIIYPAVWYYADPRAFIGPDGVSADGIAILSSTFVWSTFFCIGWLVGQVPRLFRHAQKQA